MGQGMSPARFVFVTQTARMLDNGTLGVMTQLTRPFRRGNFCAAERAGLPVTGNAAMDDIVEWNKFYHKFPVYVLADKQSVVVQPDGRGNIANAAFVGGDAEGVNFVAVFTEPDYAERYAKQLAGTETVTLTFRDAGHFGRVVNPSDRSSAHIAYDQERSARR